MALETATYIDGLVSTNPTATDPKSQGDDHIRLLKSTVKATFPNVTGAVTPTHTELNYVDGVTSAIQTQIDSKGAITGQTWTGTHAFASTTSIGNVSATEISYLDGVTSALQTQIDSKGAITGQTWTGTHVLPATTSIGNVSATEIAYLDGVTSAIQTQLDAKAPLASPALTGSPTAPTAALGSNNTLVANTAYVDQTAFSAALPAAALGFVRNDGTTTAFSQTHTGYAQKEVKGADIICAATINLSTATGNLVHITGSTGPVTDITIASGAEYTLVLDSTPTFVHNASKIILQTGANYTFAAGDVIKVRGDGTNIARITISRADGRPVRLSAMELIATFTPAVAATIDDALNIFTSTYDEYIVIGNGITRSGAASGDSLILRLANAGAADSAANYWSAATSSTSSTIASMLGSGTVGCCFEIKISNVNDSSGRMKKIRWDSMGETTGTNYPTADGQNGYIKAATVSGFRLLNTSGENFAATGEIRVYGIKRT